MGSRLAAAASGLIQLERSFARFYHLDLVTLGFQVEAQSIGKVLLVFHYQDSHSAGRVHLMIGSSNTKVLPRPGPSLSDGEAVARSLDSGEIS